MRTVVVTRFAVNQINSIYNYYCFYVTVKVAKMLKSQIIDAIKTLKQIDVEWQEDFYLIDFNKNHRRLVCGNYKIIYYFDSNQNIVYVTDVFDSRQDPINEKGSI